MDGKGRQQRAGSGAVRSPRPSPAVYRRRRLVAGILAVLILAGLSFAVVALAGALSAGGQDTSVQSTLPGPTLTSPPAAAREEGGKPAETAPAAAKETLCPAGVVRVEASTDAEIYAAGVSPVLTLTVTNTGETACEINVGTNQMEFSVASGSDRIFSSVDCQDGGQDYVKKVEPGASEKANFTWERNRSAPGCAAVASNPNPGYYIFTARLGEATSEQAIFQLE